MANFAYTVRTKDGGILKGVYEASDKATVVAGLKGKGYIPLQIAQKSGLNADIKLGFLEPKLTSKDLSVFCRQFSAVLEAGIPITQCLDIIRKQTESKKMKDILDKSYEQVQKGRSLSESLREFKSEIPQMMISMIEAGEASGTLDNVMGRLAIYFANANRLQSKVKGALMYPISIAVVTVLAVIVLMWKVVPSFEGMYSGMGSELPASTRFVSAISRFISANIAYIFIGLVGAVAGITYFARTKSGKEFFDKLILKVPVFSMLYKKMFAARFTRTAASLLSSGLPLIRAIEITDRVIDNTVMTYYLEKVRENITKGTKFSDAVAQVPIMPAMVTNMINIGEESGRIDSLLDKTADFFEEETDEAVESLTTMLEPLVIAFMAAVVGGIVIAIVQPMFGMFDAIKNA